jgi:TorA maturation chaperone TorD
VDITEEDSSRARLYALLASLLRAPPGQELLDVVAGIEGDDESELGRALKALGAAARKTTVDQVSDEFHALFIGITRGELLPYASYYLTGFLHEKPLARLRGDMARLGIARADAVKEPEDHIAALCEMMSGLITGVFGGPAALAAQQEFFGAHLEPWAPRFFRDLEAARSAALYMPVGTIGRLFMAVEREAFKMAA